MSTRRIDELVWMALTDATFCERLLNGRRREVLDTLGLTDEEQQAVLMVKADTLESFAGALCQPGFFGA
jgi:hypothetical protein